MHKSSLRKLVILLPGMAAMAVCWALPALAVSEADVEAAVASQGKEAVSGNLFVWFLCAIAFLKVSTKLDSILQAMGLGVGRAPGSILAEAFMALRGMQTGKAILSGQMPGAGSRSAAAGAGATSAFSGGLAGMVSSKLETDTAASMSGSGGGVTSGLSASLYTAETETKIEMVDKIVDGVPTKVPETHDYTTYTISYAGDNYFADTIWQLDETERAFASDYAQNLTLYLQEIEEREGISILEQVNDLTSGSTVPVAEGDFGNPFNDPAWRSHITSRFGKRPDVGLPGKDTTNHNGLDIAYGYGTPILAVQSGTVITATTSPSYGNYLVIDHGGGICTLYAHCSRLLVSVGQTVSKYDTIAEVGSTGDSTGNHLHICFIVNGQYTDPEQYLH